MKETHLNQLYPKELGDALQSLATAGIHPEWVQEYDQARNNMQVMSQIADFARQMRGKLDQAIFAGEISSTAHQIADDAEDVFQRIEVVTESSLLGVQQIDWGKAA